LPLDTARTWPKPPKKVRGPKNFWGFIGTFSEVFEAKLGLGDAVPGEVVQNVVLFSVLSSHKIWFSTINPEDNFAQGVSKKMSSILARPIAPSYVSPNAGGRGVAGSQPMSTAVHMEPKQTLEIYL
jgi:hypothetical protein